MTNEEIYRNFADDKDYEYLQNFFNCSLAGIRKWERLDSKIPDRAIKTIQQKIENDKLKEEIINVKRRNDFLEEHLNIYFESEDELLNQLEHIEGLKNNLNEIANSINITIERTNLYKHNTKQIKKSKK